MAHITSIGAGIYSDLSIGFHPVAVTTNATSTDSTLPSGGDSATPATALAAWVTYFTTEQAISGAVADVAGADFVRVPNIREFPAIGTPPNIVNVPTYGQPTSQQIQGQSDAPSMEIQMNYVPSIWAAGTILGSLVGDGKTHAFRFTLLNSNPPGYSSASGATGLGGATGAAVGNSQYFWLGKIEALVVNPQLTDANTATLTLSIQSKMYGAFTTAVQLI